MRTVMLMLTRRKTLKSQEAVSRRSLPGLNSASKRSTKSKEFGTKSLRTHLMTVRTLRKSQSKPKSQVMTTCQMRKIFTNYLITLTTTV